ncbi:Hypothetical_protein [Hexamita inflata]|uniref:Hypothetical_protein n=1 Tax=Hexamita inflata TaxID=28002 RepID=A0AA86TM93_9EUKA|nr:Hypothetical protein HINF_LOCUS4743 [Hexamita inflata]
MNPRCQVGILTQNGISQIIRLILQNILSEAIPKQVLQEGNLSSQISQVLKFIRNHPGDYLNIDEYVQNEQNINLCIKTTLAQSELLSFLYEYSKALADCFRNHSSIFINSRKEYAQFVNMFDDLYQETMQICEYYIIFQIRKCVDLHFDLYLAEIQAMSFINRLNKSINGHVVISSKIILRDYILLFDRRILQIVNESAQQNIKFWQNTLETIQNMCYHLKKIGLGWNPDQILALVKIGASTDKVNATNNYNYAVEKLGKVIVKEFVDKCCLDPYIAAFKDK